MVNLLLCVRWPACVHPAALCVATTAPTLCVPVRSNRAHRSVGSRRLVRWGPRSARVRTAPLYGAQRPHAARSEAASALPPATGRSVRILSPFAAPRPACPVVLGWLGGACAVLLRGLGARQLCST